MTQVSPRRGEVWADRDGYEYLIVSDDVEKVHRLLGLNRPGPRSTR